MARFSPFNPNLKQTLTETQTEEEKKIETEVPELEPLFIPKIIHPKKENESFREDAKFESFVHDIAIKLYGDFPGDEFKALVKRFYGISNLLFADEQSVDQFTTSQRIIDFLSVLRYLIDGTLRDNFMSKNIAKNWEEIAQYWQMTLSPLNYECFVVLYIDTNDRVVFFEKSSNSFADRVIIEFKAIISNVTKLCASSILLLHNHPSRSSEPSKEDISITHELRKLLEAIDVKIYDHIIVSRGDIFSFKLNYIL